MLLNEYLDKLKKDNFKELNKPWLNSELVNNETLDKIFPDEKAEEWKNFNVKDFINKKWKLLKSENRPLLNKENISFKNLIVFNNGVLDKTFSIDWDKFKNSIIVTNVDGTKKISTRIFEIIDFSQK